LAGGGAAPSAGPDSACEREGAELEGPELEGPELEGPELEGPELEGPELEGAGGTGRGGGPGSNVALGADGRLAGAASHTESGGACTAGVPTSWVRVGTDCVGITVHGRSEVGSLAGSHGGAPETLAWRTVGFGRPPMVSAG
jgi:hypothetical protein